MFKHEGDDNEPIHTSLRLENGFSWAIFSSYCQNLVAKIVCEMGLHHVPF